ncbi:MAG: peptidoglycan DD-metalloendopeptidase family protein [Cyanobacteria bacterium P01_D01_bin.105]
MKEAMSQEMKAESGHSCIPQENENTPSGISLKSAAMLGIALSMGASGVAISQAEASAAVSAPSASQTKTLSSEASSATDISAGATYEIVAYHTVEAGESLWQISQRHRVGLRELKEANALPIETSISVGQVLKVPAVSQSIEASNASSTVFTASIGTGSDSTPFSPQAEQAQGSEAGRSRNLVGQSAERREAEISIEVGETSLQAVQENEGVTSAAQDVALGSASPESLVTEPTVTALAAPTSFSHYQVRSGDTLHRIASSLGTTSEEIIRANGLADPNLILAGDTLRVPSSNMGYVPARTTPLANVNVASSQQVADKRTDSSSQLAYLRDTAVRPEGARLLEDLRQATPQEPASVGGEAVTANDLLSSRPGSAQSIDPYVENLLEEVREIRSRSVQTTSVQTTEVETEIAEDEVAKASGADSDRASLLARRNDRLTSSSSVSERVSRSEQLQVTGEIDAELLAAAPLSPDAYIPAQRPSTGQVVSPDMPILPDADEFLPEAPSYFNGYIWPARGTLTSGYGWRWGRMHRGIDVAGPVGTPIVAAAAGIVERAGWNSGGFGNLVEIRHPDGSLTRYAHNNRLNVSTGQTVRQGQQIAEMGSTGYSTGPHLHFELHPSDSGAVNPMAYLPGQ